MSGVTGSADGRTVPRVLARIAAVVASLLMTSGCAGTHRPTTAATSVIGATVFAAGSRAPLPDIDAPTLAGSRIALPGREMAGVTVLNVWASWCTECRSESPAIAALARRLRGQDVTFIGIDEQDSAGAARAFARSTGMTYPHIVDTDGAVLSRLTPLPSYAIPSTLLVDRNGDMAARIVGATTGPQLQTLIEKINK